ncbi:hypothetical protein K8T06_12535, partial [bacterium]|nr:hypothetical protein [bacterium]
IIDDPLPESSGAWIAELFYERPGDAGSVTRVGDTDIEIRTLGCMAIPQVSGIFTSLTFNGFSFPNELSDTLLPVRSESLSVSFSDTIKEIEMVNDDFSSLYCFILTENSETGIHSISWICDGLLYRDATHRDRLTYPYDIEFIPLVWTPVPGTSTPTPTGTPPTATPTPPAGLWVADMAGHRVIRVNNRGHLEAETHTEDISAYTPVWSEYENFGLISPNDVSAAYDGTCWAIDWGRNEVVKINVDGAIVARTTACEFLDPDGCSDEKLMIHPLAIDCGGDPNSCFVADYEGHRIYKLILEADNSFTTVKSDAHYINPKAIAVTRKYDFGQTREQVWVADRWNNEPTPSQSYTFTPVPTLPPLPGTTTPTAVPATETPYPEHQRVSMVEFGYTNIEFFVSCSIPISLSVINNIHNEAYCVIADRDAGNSRKAENYVRWLTLTGAGVEETHIGGGDGRKIGRPVDVEVVGAPPTWTPTPVQLTPTPTQ